jgi:hypothetical protein
MRFGGLLLFTFTAVLLQLDSADYKRLLENLRNAIRKCGLMEKEVMHACGVTDPSVFSKMLNGKARLPMDVYAAMPEAVHQQMVIEEAERVGFPEYVKRAAVVMGLVNQERRRA